MILFDRIGNVTRATLRIAAAGQAKSDNT